MRPSRRTERGAAMVEAVIVVSTMLVFMGIIVFTRRAYGMKLDLQQWTRANALDYASHACTGATQGAEQTTGSVDVSGSPDVEAAAEKSKVAGGAAASRALNTATTRAGGTVSWQAVW